MKSIKARKMDIISGLTEIEIYYYPDLYNIRNDLFNRIVPDIVASNKVNLFKLQLQGVDRNSDKQRFPMIS